MTYEFARESKIENLGEDLKGSARHRRNQYSTVEEMIEDGVVSSMLKRDKILKNANISYSIPHSLNLFFTHACLRALPPQVKISSSTENERASQEQYLSMVNHFIAFTKKVSEREDFEQLSLKDINSLFSKEGISMIKGYRAENRRSDVANSLCDYVNNRLSSYTYSSGLLTKFRKIPSSLNIKEACIKFIEQGQTFPKSTNQSEPKETKETFKRSSMYGNSVERIGEVRDFGDLDLFLKEKVKLRGVQYGNSLPDKERLLHRNMFANAMVDFSELFDIPLSSTSKDGKLGIAFGARGVGSGLAHYEPANCIINLTRKKGFGSLAHELGHMIDSEAALKLETKTRYASHTVLKRVETSHDDLLRAYNSLQNKLRVFLDRVAKDPLFALIPRSKRKYWLSYEEAFARCFETFVAQELISNNQKNDYLCLNILGAMWPNQEELNGMKKDLRSITKAVLGE